MPQALSSSLCDMDVVNAYIAAKNPDVDGYKAINTSGTLIQTHQAKYFGKTSGPASTNRVGTVLIICNRTSYGLLAMQEWSEVILDFAGDSSNASKVANTEWLVHLHLNRPLMHDWQISTFEKSLIKRLDEQGKAKNIRYAIDFSAWLGNREASTLSAVLNPDPVPEDYGTKISNAMASRASRLKTIPYGLLRSYGLHKALLLNQGSKNSGDDDVYMLVDVEPTDALSPSKVKQHSTVFTPADATTALDNRKLCFAETWKKLIGSKKVVYNKLDWKSNHPAAMANEWYEAKYPAGVPQDEYQLPLADGQEKTVKATIAKNQDTRLKVDLAMKDCMDALVRHMNTAAANSTYPSEPLLGFRMQGFTTPTSITCATETSKSKIGVEKSLSQAGKTISYVQLSNIMGIGSGEGKSLAKSIDNGNETDSGKRIWTSAWGVLKDIVVQRFSLKKTEVTGKAPHYDPEVRITVGHLKDMGGIDAGNRSSDSVLIEIKAEG